MMSGRYVQKDKDHKDLVIKQKEINQTLTQLQSDYDESKRNNERNINNSNIETM